MTFKQGVMNSEAQLDSLTMQTPGATKITRMYTIKQTLTPASVGANTTAVQTFTVNGLAVGDSIDVNKPAYNASAFEAPSMFAGGNYLGTGPRVSTVRGSPYRDTNISLSKGFVIKERLRIEVRAETFNIFNNHYFTCDGQAFGDCIPFNNDPSSSKFGTWNGTVSQPRNVQLVGRITF